MSTIQIKAYVHPQGSIRRFNVDTNTTFDEFQQHIKQSYPDHIQALDYQYLDEEDDLISFSTEHEWKGALENHLLNEAKLLRIKIKPSLVRRPQPQFFRPQCQRPRCFPQFVRQQPRVAPSEHDIENIIKHYSPILKSLFGVDIEIERESQNAENLITQESHQQQEAVQQPEKVEEQHEEKQGEEIEEIIIPDDEPVEEKKEEVEPEPVAQEEAVVETPTKFVQQLETLTNMGFNNVKLNEHLLNNFDGDLVRVVNALVQLSINH
jgi:hypothetical protein